MNIERTMLRKQLPGLFIALALLLMAQLSAAQTNTELFGQNRVQYRNFKWKVFDTKHFRIYHYDRSGVSLARYVCEQAEQDIPLMEKKLGGRFPDRFNIILYNNYEEYRQTNTGLKIESQLQDVSAGTLDLVGDKLLVYFNGVHTDLRRQIRLGIARVMIQRLLFGDDAKSIAKNAISQNMPRWTTEGYTAYVVDGWDAKSETEWKNHMDAQPNANFYLLADQYPELAGKAFWKYVSDHYGEESIVYVLRTMQQRSNLNKGIKEALGMRIKPAYDSCLAYYRRAFAKDLLVQETPDSSKSLISIKVPTDGTIIRNMRVSPRGRDIVYSEFKEGEYKIYIQHTGQEQQRSLILSTGRSDFNELTPDADYPIICWSNNGYKIAILYRYKRQTRVRVYNSLKAKIENYIIPPNRFDRVLGMAFNEEDDKLVISAIKKSQTDLYYFAFRRSVMTNITNDPWDDVQPTFISGGSRRGILFLSNRPVANINAPAAVNELPTGPMNLYFYDTKTMSPVLLKCTDNQSGNITQPIQYGPDNFAYLRDDNGIQNKYVVVFGRNVHNMDSAMSVPVTNYSRSILSHQYNPASNQVADVLQLGDAYKVYFSPMLIPGVNVQAKTLQKTTLSTPLNKAALMTAPATLKNRPNGVDLVPERESPLVKPGNIFQTEFSDTANNTQRANAGQRPQTVASGDNTDTTDLLNPSITDSTYLKLKAKPYRASFKPDFLTLRLDNTVLFSKYQASAYNGNQFSNPPLGGLLSVSLNDALENQRYTGGIRLPTSAGEGMTWFLQYQNFTKRMDWGLVLLRTTNKNNYAVTYADSTGNPVLLKYQTGKVSTTMIQGNIDYPLDRIRRIGLTLGGRQDALRFQADDSLSLLYTPPAHQYWAMTRAEFVFDNSRAPIQNIRFGFRYKFYAEYMYGFSEGAKGNLYNLGLDFRYYKKLYKNAIVAIRLAGAHSAGDQRILYLLGGVDNQLNPPGNAPPTSSGQDYSFQAMATNLRGYKQNARSGNTYSVGNFELRVPVLNTLLDRPIRSAILRSIQLIGFLDAGGAWDGILPSTSNMNKPLTYFNSQGTAVATVDYNPGFAMGYGAGMRATLFGYFLRLDAAWNIDRKPKPLWYFSIGTDF